MVHEGTAVIEVDDEAEYEALLEFAKHFVPAAVDKLHHYEGERPLFEQYDIDEEIELALGRRVELKSGGYLVFDQTEAMSTIDVNTGAYVGKRDFSDTVFKLTWRQLRLLLVSSVYEISAASSLSTLLTWPKTSTAKRC